MHEHAAFSIRKKILLLSVLLVFAASVTIVFLFRSLITELAVSDAQDAVVATINNIVKEIMSEEKLAEHGLVTLEENAAGRISAVTTNVAAVNILAADVMEAVVSETSETVITVSLPMGNLSGSAVLLNRGPEIPVQVMMLSSSMGGFRSELVSAGINQTRHQILLNLEVELTLLMPWRTIDTTVETEILVSETVIVGDVPDSYLNWEN